MNTKEKIAVMQAWLDGKEVKCKNKDSDYWVSLPEPSYDPSYTPKWNWEENEYRIKPADPIPVVLYALYQLIPDQEPALHSVYPREEACKEYAERRFCGKHATAIVKLTGELQP